MAGCSAASLPVENHRARPLSRSLFVVHIRFSPSPCTAHMHTLRTESACFEASLCTEGAHEKVYTRQGSGTRRSGGHCTGAASCCTFSRGVRRQRRGFSREIFPHARSRTEDTQNSCLPVFFPTFFPALVARLAFFGRANVILIARLSALLCEFARHFFVSFRAELLIQKPGGSTSLVEFPVSHPPPPFNRTAVFARGETKISPLPLSVPTATLLVLSPSVVSRRRVCVAAGSRRNDADAWTSRVDRTV